MRICGEEFLPQVVGQGISLLQEQHRGVQLGAWSQECELDKEVVFDGICRHIEG